MNLYLPPDYRPMLPTEGMEDAIKLLKQTFQAELAEALSLRRVTAPLFVFADSGLNDNLNGVERPVSFPIKDMGDRRAEVVHSLAKWKRMKLAAYRIPPGQGLYTDMNAIRADEELDNIHSLYVDQWDWERTIRPEDRTVEFLSDIVRRIYGALLATEAVTHRAFPHIPPTLPREITFVHAEELRAEFPDLSPKEREREATRRYGAVFIRGIGGPLSDGSRHDGRAPDYDDWSTPTPDGLHGLNGDILVWNAVLDAPLELSSMGIRVDPAALLRQLEMTGCMDRLELPFHRALAAGEMPPAVGGGIGQSRLCMYLLRCAHIGEVQAALWPEVMVARCAEAGVTLR